MQQQTHLTSNKIPRQPKKIWKQVLLRKTKEKLYPKVLDNYRGSRELNLGVKLLTRHNAVTSASLRYSLFHVNLTHGK